MLISIPPYPQLHTLIILSISVVANVSSSTSSPLTPTAPNPPTTFNDQLIVPRKRQRRRFTFHGPILTLTLKDPFADEGIENLQSFSSSPVVEPKEEEESPFSSSPPNDDDMSEAASKSTKTSTSNPQHVLRTRRLRFWSRKSNPTTYSNFLKLNSLAPTLFYSIRSNGKPLPNYLPSLQSTSISAGYKYDDVKDKPSFVEGEMKFRKVFGTNIFGGSGRQMGIEVDIGPSYSYKEKKGALVLRIGGDTSGTAVENGISDENNGYGCFGLARFVMTKGKKCLEYVRGSYQMNLPFATVGSISITPSYDFEKGEPTCNIVGKSSLGRTAAVLDLNWDNPTLSVVHALDQRNTISPEISLYDAKILYNWSVALDTGSIKTRVDPCSAIQVTWTDQGLNGKWVTDFKLPLVGNPGPLAGDIRIRRQFLF